MLYPQFAYATFEMAMVHVARGHLSKAEDLVRAGVVEQDRQVRAGDRFPSIGFHWLLGALESARGRHAYAIAEFNQELAQIDRRRLYGPEYGAVALVARGQAELATGQAAQAIASFQAARLYVEDYPRAWVGEALALAETGDAAAADQARRHARHAHERFERTDGTTTRGTPRRAQRRSTATTAARSAGSITCSPLRREATSAGPCRSSRSSGRCTDCRASRRSSSGWPARRNSSNVGLKTRNQRFSGFLRRVSGLARCGRHIFGGQER